MKPVTNLMINEFKIKELGYDFMGFNFSRTNELSFHHLIIPRKDCHKKKVPCDGYIRENGAILRQNTSHDYLHKVQEYDRELFLAITDEMIMENLEGKISPERLKRILAILTYFEKEHCSTRTSSGKLLIKREYLADRIRI